MRCPGSRTRELVSGALERGAEGWLFVGVGDSDEHVDDRLGREAGHRRRADVLDPPRDTSERPLDPRWRSSANRCAQLGSKSGDHDLGALLAAADQHRVEMGVEVVGRHGPSVATGDPGR